jgi:type II secretory pathway component PulF
MTTFAWTGKTRQGTLQKGEVSAKSREEVMTLLRKQNILVTSVQQKARSFDLTSRSVARLKKKISLCLSVSWQR